jgi:hypothetical protein
MSIKYLSLLLISFLLSSTVTAGWVISEVSSDRFGNKSYQTTFLQNNKVRYESDLSVAVIDIDKELITLIFPLQKVYWEGSADDFKKGTLEAFDKQMKAMIRQSDPDQKETYQQFYDEILKKINSTDTLEIETHITVEALEGEAKIGEYNTRAYNIYIDSVLNEKIWITFDKTPFKNVNLKKLMALTKKMSPMNSGLSVTNSNSYINLVQRGMGVKTEKYINGQPATTTSITLVREGPIPDSFFSAPPLYRKASIAEVLEMGYDSDIPDINRSDNPDNPDYKGVMPGNNK